MPSTRAALPHLSPWRWPLTSCQPSPRMTQCPLPPRGQSPAAAHAGTLHAEDWLQPCRRCGQTEGCPAAAAAAGSVAGAARARGVCSLMKCCAAWLGQRRCYAACSAPCWTHPRRHLRRGWQGGSHPHHLSQSAAQRKTGSGQGGTGRGPGPRQCLQRQKGHCSWMSSKRVEHFGIIHGGTSPWR